MNQAIAEQIQKLDPQLQPDDPNYQAAAFLLASLEVGPSVVKVQKFTGMRKSQASVFGHQARRNGIWKNGQVHADWFNEETGGIAFWMDVMVLTGMMQRV